MFYYYHHQCATFLFVFFPIKNDVDLNCSNCKECCSQNEGELDRFEANHPKLEDMDELKLVLLAEITLSWDLFLIP